MKRFMLNTVLSLAMLVLTGSISAFTPMTRANIQTLIKEISSRTVSGDAIWDRIKALNIPANEDNSPLTKELDKAALTSLMNDGYPGLTPNTRLTQDIRAGKPQPTMVESTSTRVTGEPKSDTKQASLEPVKTEPVTIKKASATVVDIVNKASQGNTSPQSTANKLEIADTAAFYNSLQQESQQALVQGLLSQPSQGQLIEIQNMVNTAAQNDTPVIVDLSQPATITVTPIEKVTVPGTVVSRPATMIEIKPEIIDSSKLTLQNALVALKAVQDGAETAQNTDEIKSYFKDFYQIQDTYFGLSGAPKKTGTLWWKTIVEPSEKEQFVKASKNTLTELFKNELRILKKDITPLKLSLDANAENVLAFNTINNVYEDYKDKKITSEQLDTIMKARSQLLYWNNLINNPFIPLSTKDLTEISTLLEEINKRNISKYVQIKLQNDKDDIITKLQTYLKQQEAELSKLSTIKDKEIIITQEIVKLNKTINDAIDALKNKGSITQINFEKTFTAIDTNIKKIDNKQTQEALSKEALKTFRLFGSYLSVTQSLDKNIFEKINSSWQEYWNPFYEKVKVAQTLDEQLNLVKDLQKQYRAFPTYILKNDQDRNTLLNEQFADATSFKEILQKSSEEEQLDSVQVILMELSNKLMDLQKKLAKNQVEALKNFARYKNFMKAAFNVFPTNSPNAKATLDGWNFCRKLYAEHLLNVTQVYRNTNNLSQLHLLATGETNKIIQNIDNIIPQDPYNAIATMLNDLTDFLNNNDNSAINTKINNELVENLCYMLAAFDAFGYAVFSGGVQANARTDWYSWFWGLVGYQMTASTAEDFRKKNVDLVNKFLIGIANAITNYEIFILSKIKSDAKTKYQSKVLSILKELGTEKSKNAKLYNEKETAYRYNLIPTVPLKLAGGIETNAQFEPIDEFHKKNWTYNSIVTNYQNILAIAYKDNEWLQITNANKQFEKMKDFAQERDKEVINPLNVKLNDLNQQLKTAETIEEITKIETQIKNERINTEETLKSMQENYIKQLEKIGIKGAATSKSSL